MTVSLTGSYRFHIRSPTEPLSYLYNHSFVPELPELNFLLPGDPDTDGGSYQFTITLTSLLKYILVASTFASDGIGNYAITISGLSEVAILSTDNTSVISAFNGTTSSKYKILSVIALPRSYISRRVPFTF